MTTPRDFIANYVDPALEAFRKDLGSRHLAAHAIAQMDILAEVVGLWEHSHSSNPSRNYNPAPFRKNLDAKHRQFAVIHDAHDSHKHGKLRDQTRLISKGQRTETSQQAAFFLDATPLNGDLTSFDIVVLTDNCGHEWWVNNLLIDTRKLWEQELQDRGL